MLFVELLQVKAIQQRKKTLFAYLLRVEAIKEKKQCIFAYLPSVRASIENQNLCGIFIGIKQKDEKKKKIPSSSGQRK